MLCVFLGSDSKNHHIFSGLHVNALIEIFVLILIRAMVNSLLAILHE